MRKKFLKNKIIIIAIISFAICGIALKNDQIARIVLPLVLGKNGESAFEKFIYECQNGSSLGIAEDMLNDSLIVSGWRATAVVASRIDDSSLPCRRYAISYLGNVRAVKAISQLEKIFLNEKEESFFRIDALEAILQIEESRGRVLASQVVTSFPALKEDIEMLLSDKHRFKGSKSYWQAVFRVHE